MVTSEKPMDEKPKVKRYKIQYAIDEYTLPKEAYIHDVKFDEKYMHVELTDQRIVSIEKNWRIKREIEEKVKISPTSCGAYFSNSP